MKAELANQSNVQLQALAALFDEAEPILAPAPTEKRKSSYSKSRKSRKRPSIPYERQAPQPEVAAEKATSNTEVSFFLNAWHI